MRKFSGPKAIRPWLRSDDGTRRILAVAMREVAVQHQCLVCYSNFMIVVDLVPSASAFPGKKGTQRFENLLEKVGMVATRAEINNWELWQR